jgi:hypothetical protein
MKQIAHSLTIALSVFLVFPLSMVSAQLESVQDAQSDVREGASEFAQSLKPIFEELAELGASEADLSLIRQTLGELNQMTDEEMAAILLALSAAMENPGAEGSDEQLQAAFKGQVSVFEGLRKIMERLRDRQTELAIATKADALRRRQAENQHQTEMLRQEQGDAIAAEAEQRALEEAINELVRELEAIQESAEQEGADDSATDEAALERMEALAEQATEQMEAGEYDQAAQTQKELGEMLADLAAETGMEQASEEFLEDLVRQLKSILERQTALKDAGLQGAPDVQEELAIKTESLRIPTENVNAPAGFQVAAAAKSMRLAIIALSAEPPALPTDAQVVAIVALERAIELLEENLEEMEESGGEGEGDDMAELAQMYQQAQNLQNQQNQQNQSDGSPGNQAQIARDTAALQEDAQELSPEAARQLGRAAARMAEALDPELDEAERERLEEAAAEQLGAAVQSIQSEGRARRNTPPGQGTGGQFMEDVELSDDLLGPPELSPADRAAIESARREPVGQEYAPLVEAYYEQLSRQCGQE